MLLPSSSTCFSHSTLPTTSRQSSPTPHAVATPRPAPQLLSHHAAPNDTRHAPQTARHASQSLAYTQSFLHVQDLFFLPSTTSCNASTKFGCFDIDGTGAA